MVSFLRTSFRTVRTAIEEDKVPTENGSEPVCEPDIQDDSHAPRPQEVRSLPISRETSHERFEKMLVELILEYEYNIAVNARGPGPSTRQQYLKEGQRLGYSLSINRLIL